MTNNFRSLIQLTGHEVLALAEARKTLQKVAQDAGLTEELVQVDNFLGALLSRARDDEAIYLFNAVDQLSEHAMPEEWEVLQQAAQDGELRVADDYEAEYDDIEAKVLSSDGSSVELDNELADKIAPSHRWSLVASIRRQIHYASPDDALEQAGKASRDSEYDHGQEP